ncbi:MAG: hypothetical protein KDC85_21060 [Saprospiraceae bacterium]|nr:hypothetical protein [Saprospiraceae bacterium]MCB9326499.1 hypothetical protein [Lewinellaceae bacterium]
MLRLLKIELTKLYTNRFFRVLGALWIFAFFTIPVAFNYFLEWIQKNEPVGAEQFLKADQWPIFDFVDIWQNLAYLYKMVTIFICFIVLASVTNEFDYKTIRQNVIDGMSRREFWLSKIVFMLGISMLATIFLALIGFAVGYSLSPVTEPEFVFRNIEFMGAYFLQVFYLLMFCFVVSLLIKRAGFAFASILFYIYILEPITTLILSQKYKLELLADCFPSEAGWNLIRLPFEKYLLMYSQDYVSYQDLGIASVWLVIFLLVSYWLVNRRDL